MTSTLGRVLEPEVMDTADEARDYDAMDHALVNERFCADLRAQGDLGATVLDVGTGTARIPIELCRADANLRVVAIDLAEHMLALAGENVARAGFAGRVTLAKVDAKKMPYEDGAFATTVSNSIIHHIPDPRAALAEMARVTAPGGLVFVRDLARPASEAEVDRLVTLYAGEAPPEPAARASFERQRDLFRASLRAALTVEEITAMANDAGLSGCAVAPTSDRHWTLSLRKP
ncbi:MAG: class I SAM-dependent methyltransferase [Labilithrix sp.]|nr:class I SAM-dependent methyltransferase [Labilithrix sp.]